MDDKVIGSRVRARRRALGKTQVELSAEADVSQSYLALIEKGERQPTLDTLRRLAEALDTTPGWLTAEGTCAAAVEGARSVAAIKRLLGSPDGPAGLRALASDEPLSASLGITEAEWRALASVELPGEATKLGYVHLLLTIRAIVDPAPGLAGETSVTKT